MVEQFFCFVCVYIDQYSTKSGSSSKESQSIGEFHLGDFIIAKNEILNDWPLLWRVNGKTLLQRFEPLHASVRTVYRSIATVSRVYL